MSDVSKTLLKHQEYQITEGKRLVISYEWVLVRFACELEYKIIKQMSYCVAWSTYSCAVIQSNSQNVLPIPSHLISFALLNRTDCSWEGWEEVLTQLIGLKK